MVEGYLSPASSPENPSPFQLGGKPVYTHLSVCEVLRERLEAEDTQRLRAGVLGRIKAQANLPNDAGPGDLETFEARYAVDAENAAVLHMLRRFAAACSQQGTPQCGMTIQGLYGAGKTTLVVALIRTLVRRGISARFENVPQLMDALKNAVRTKTLEERLTELQEFPVLVLDDLGRERPSPFTVDDVLYTLVDHRYRHGLPTIITTNFTRDELEARYERAGNERGEGAVNGAAIVDRLRQWCPWLELSGESRRQPELDF
jgi:DNA replication protein DnaC